MFDEAFSRYLASSLLQAQQRHKPVVAGLYVLRMIRALRQHKIYPQRGKPRQCLIVAVLQIQGGYRAK